ncbi:hypothetical protein Ddye_013837 [Dipteronia dyeriana]|uniref:Glutaminyl-peptide cyclotransferase n=1 Tax=Dipteronia dyeriana TaxID=168575 RepID=A0AAE0CK18_9ROSI|nr:hypothetical protein Ddye_013837 [Dipteronia dyeriana]
MASKFSKKKPTKRSTPSSSSSSSYMDPSHMSRFTYKKPPPFVLIFVFVCFVSLLVISSSTWSKFAYNNNKSNVYGIELVNEFPHDPRAFTQGLLYAGNNTLFESTGLYGRSSVRLVALQTGEVEEIKTMEHAYFGEGLTLLGERLFQVTWLKKTGFIYDRNNLSKVQEFTHQMKDGWGLATDGKVLFGSDGTSTLYQIDPQTFKVIWQHIVKYKGHEIQYLNELEFINGEVWANVWQTDCIARISPKDGMVLGWILLPHLREGLVAAGNGIDVLNGIAWDGEKKRLFVTGKLWPKLYEIKVHPPKKQIDDSLIERFCLLGGRL